MNNTSRMAQLLGAFRRERNGLVADTMHYEGKRYGLNYGVSLPTVRRLARAEEADHTFARYLYGQDVRCLKLAAYHLADPVALTDPAECAFWLAGVTNSELAEEAAFAFFSRSETLLALMKRLPELQEMQRYMCLMAAARAPQPQSEWLQASLLAVQPFAQTPFIHCLQRGLVVLWAHIAQSGEALRCATAERLATLGHAPWEEYLREELAWRLEC